MRRAAAARACAFGNSAYNRRSSASNFMLIMWMVMPSIWHVWPELSTSDSHFLNHKSSPSRYHVQRSWIMPMNKLYFGDMLREKIKDESVDLVYLVQTKPARLAHRQSAIIRSCSDRPFSRLSALKRG